jgi:hypothetical protein
MSGLQHHHTHDYIPWYTLSTRMNARMLWMLPFHWNVMADRGALSHRTCEHKVRADASSPRIPNKCEHKILLPDVVGNVSHTAKLFWQALTLTQLRFNSFHDGGWRWFRLPDIYKPPSIALKYLSKWNTGHDKLHSIQFARTYRSISNITHRPPKQQSPSHISQPVTNCIEECNRFYAFAVIRSPQRLKCQARRTGLPGNGYVRNTTHI